MPPINPLILSKIVIESSEVFPHIIQGNTSYTICPTTPNPPYLFDGTKETFQQVSCGPGEEIISDEVKTNTYWSSGPFTFGKEETFFGFDFDLHAGAGGHIKIGWDIPSINYKYFPGVDNYY